VLESAGKLKASDKRRQAVETVRVEAAPLWLKLAPEVRRAMLHFQRIVATRNDLGTLASKHNKFVRLALIRLRLSMKEYLGELPAETESLFGEVMRSDAEAPARLFVPTRPGILSSGEQVRVMVVAPGAEGVRGVWLHTRVRDAVEWSATPARLVGRRTYEARLGPFDSSVALAEYYFSAEVGGAKLTAPPEAPRNTYSVTLT
jgi:hypothetical protein